MVKFIGSFVAVLLCGALVLLGEVRLARAAAVANPPSTADADGLALLQRACSRCHDLERVLTRRQSASDWEDVVSQMLAMGAQLNDVEAAKVQAYLVAHYGTQDTGAQDSSATQASTPPP